MLWHLLLSVLFGAVAAVPGAERAGQGPGRVIVAPAKTSILVGSVTLTLTDFLPHAGAYEARYAARVFPFSFLNETGVLSVPLSEEDWQNLEQGEAITFRGAGRRTDGAVRLITGRAVPDDAKSGRLKVRVVVARGIELVFDTHYRTGDVVERADGRVVGDLQGDRDAPRCRDHGGARERFALAIPNPGALAAGPASMRPAANSGCRRRTPAQPIRSGLLHHPDAPAPGRAAPLNPQQFTAEPVERGVHRPHLHGPARSGITELFRPDSVR